MKNADTAALTRTLFKERENDRRRLFSAVWAESIPQVFRDVPKYYRFGNIVASFGIWEIWVWQFVRSFRLQPGARILDVCAGTNDVGIRLLRRQPDAAVTAIDRSGEMQEEGQARAAHYKVKIDSVIQDVHSLPFADQSFDVVTLQAASRHLQLDLVLPEILRVLKPGGWFYHCDMLKPGNPVVAWLYVRFLRLTVAWTALLFRSNPVSRNCRDYFKDAIANFYTPEEFSAILSLVGFEDVGCRKSLWGGMVGFHRARKPG